MPAADHLAAERELGRLVQALEDDPETAALHRHDALRREAHASLQLDGQLVDLDDIAAGQMSLGLLSGQRVAGAEAALALIRAAAAMQRGLRGDDAPPPADDDQEDGLEDLDDLLPAEPEAEDDEPLRSEPFRPSFVQDTRSMVADIHSFLERSVPKKQPEASGSLVLVLEPLSEAWLVKAWTMAWGAPDADEAAALARAAEEIAAALAAKPGLAGVALALYRLHQDGFWPAAGGGGVPDSLRDWVAEDRFAQLELMRAENQPVGSGWRFSRLLAPWLVQRACHLVAFGPWISEALLSGRYGYPQAASLDVAAWESWLARMLAEGFPAQRRRLAELRTRQEVWRRKLGAGRRPTRGGPLAALPLLVERPVMLPGWMATRTGVTTRAAQMTLAQLEKAGVVRETSGRYCFKVWAAV